MTPVRRPRESSTELADRLHSAAIHVLRYLRGEDDALGLSAPKLSALSVLVFRGPLTMGELARAEQVTPATVSKLVAELERLGLVVRAGDPGDARVWRVSPTREGITLMKEGRRRRVARLASAMEGLGQADRATLARAADVLEAVVAEGAHRPRG
jgi:DNA-binding MarR family transcriptional regulator